MTRPEPVASWTDYVTALQKEEDAIHAATGADTANSILAAVDYLDYAANYWDAAKNALLAAQTRTAAAQLRIYAERASKITSTADLHKFQTGVLYPFQGQLGDLLYAAQTLEPISPLVLISLGTAVLTLLLGGYITMLKRGYSIWPYHSR